jgi:hypothetical protein
LAEKIAKVCHFLTNKPKIKITSPIDFCPLADCKVTLFNPLKLRGKEGLLKDTEETALGTQVSMAQNLHKFKEKLRKNQKDE